MLNAIALYDCVADEEGELSFTEGTRFVDVVDSTEEDWLEGRIEGTSQRGLFPSNYVNVITVSTPAASKSIPKSSNNDTNLSHSVSPPNSNIFSSWSVISNTPATTDSNSSNSSTAKPTSSNAFESTIQTSPSSKYSDIATTLMNKRTMPLPTSNSPNTTIKDASHTPSSSRAFVLPALSPVQQQTRTRSFSASSTTSPAPPTALKPSALRQDFRKKAQLDTSWRTKLDNSSSPTTTPPLKDNKASITTGNDDDDIEEEDGYQLIKPSQLRKRQQQQDVGKFSTTTGATLPLSSSVSTSALPTQKSFNSKTTRLQTLPSSSTNLAKLPSRPVSNANRLSKSRSSSTRSSSSNTKGTDTTNKTAPTLKPKPAQLNNLPSTKERSASNPPPIQPKSFANSDMYRPSVDSKPLFPPATSGTKSIPPVGARSGVALPGLGKKSSAPTLPTRPPTVLSSSSVFKEHVDDNTNLKPSQLLTTQRARSSTNPTLATRPFLEATNGVRMDGAIRSPPPPPAAAKPAIPLVIKQAPPPPPPSRQTNTNNGKRESGGRTRYDVLFDTIQDDGYVDGVTVQVIWSKSRLPDDTLAGIWQQCDQQKSGLLDRQRFIHGMRQIDSHLAKT